MTVEDLIKQLQKCIPTSRVSFHTPGSIKAHIRQTDGTDINWVITEQEITEHRSKVL